MHEGQLPDENTKSSQEMEILIKDCQDLCRESILKALREDIRLNWKIIELISPNKDAN